MTTFIISETITQLKIDKRILKQKSYKRVGEKVRVRGRDKKYISIFI